MKQTLSNMKQTATKLWHDDRGAEGLEKVLILAAVALPMLALLVFFYGHIKTWVVGGWEDVQDNKIDSSDDPF